MTIHFFFKNKSDRNWYDLNLEAWQENDNTYIDGKRVSSFQLLEKIRIHISKNPKQKIARHEFHCAVFEHEFGKDSCMGHHARTVKEFKKDKTKEGYSLMIEINQKHYESFRKIAFAIYSNYPLVDYTEQFKKNAPACRILF